MQPSLPTKLDILEEEVWRSRDNKRRSAGSSLWHSAPDNSIAGSNQVVPSKENLCSVPQCEQLMVCNRGGGWATRGGPSPGNHPCCAANPCTSCRPVPTTPGMMHKKGSANRSGSDMLKRFRVQTAYELSQDLLEKQVEMLERKYGGAKARRAALVIQRAFRRYKLLNKFAAITAMAKAEKRLSRRFQVTSDMGSGNGNPGSPLDWSPSHHNYQLNTSLQGLASTPQQHQGRTTAVYLQSQYHHQQTAEIMTNSQHLPCEQCSMGFDPEVVIRNNFAALYRELRENSDQRPPRPIRSMSMRERRGGSTGAVATNNPAASRSGDPVDLVQQPQSQIHPPLPRSQSAGVTHQPPLQATEAELADRDMPSYSQFEEYCMYYTATSLAPCPHHSQHTYIDPSSTTTNHYYTTKEMLSEEDNIHSQSNGNLSRESAVRRTIATSPPSTSQNMQWPRKETTPQSNSKNSNRSSSMSGASGALSTSGEWGPQGNKKVPPEVPKRTTSILSRSRSTASPGSPAVMPGHCRGNSLLNGSVTISSVDTASLSSSDSSLSLSADRSEGADVHRDSPMWKRKGQILSPDHNQPNHGIKDENGKESSVSSSLPSQLPLRAMTDSQPPIYKVTETVRKRQYRVGLNLFNKKPERGITHLIRRGFLENSPQGVARFLITRKGLSKQMIGEYLGTLQNPFNMAVLECFAQELDLSGMHIDVALRKFQTYFRMPGEAQKIERLMEIFGQRYCQCNSELVSRFRSADTVFVLAFAIIMLNTDLHTPNLKPERRMKLEDFVKNLRGIDDSGDIDRDMLVGTYERVKNSEFKPGSDHVTQVMKVQSTIGGKKPNLALPHRRLVCYCRLYEIPDIYKKERPGVHQREVFLFNDLLVITKIFSKKKSSVTYSFRQSFTLCGMMVSTFETQYYLYGIRLSQRIDGKVLVMFNARNEHDRCKFAEDLRESICEMDEMESIRIEAELERQKSGRRRAVAENRDSGVADVEVALSPTTANVPSNSAALALAPQTPTEASPGEAPLADPPIASSSVCEHVNDRERPGNENLKRSALSNSLLDIHDQFAGEKPQRRGSVGSLDSGMSISFQSTSASTVSRDSSPQNIQPSPGGGNSGVSNAGSNGSKQTQSFKSLSHQQSFLGGLFSKRERKASRTDDVNPYSRSTEV